VSPTYSNDMVIGLLSCFGTYTVSAGTGYTLIAQTYPPSGPQYGPPTTAAEYKLDPSTGAITVSYGTGPCGSSQWTLIGDAIRPFTGSPAVDQSASAAVNYTSGGVTVPISLSTNQLWELLTVFVTFNATSVTSFRCFDHYGLNWLQRSFQSATSSYLGVYIGYAIAPTIAPYDPVTCIPNSGPTGIAMVVYGVSNADMSAPFDPGSFPSSATGTWSSAASVSVTTTYANDLVIGYLGCVGPNIIVNPYTNYAFINQVGGAQTAAGEARLVTTAGVVTVAYPQSSLNTPGPCGYADWTLVADADV
ncbi:MAG TPA: hypothetical protein VMH38_10200, partial [Thermoplasmata archaeon]|nr:hypothetical protein [Thermoplasmata archaeon]